MSYTDDRVWDSRRGWVKTNRGFRFNIRRKLPECNVTSEEIDDCVSAPINPNFSMYGKEGYRIGYTKKNSPTTRRGKFLNKMKRFEKINLWLNKIPLVKVEVIE